MRNNVKTGEPFNVSVESRHYARIDELVSCGRAAEAIAEHAAFIDERANDVQHGSRFTLASLLTQGEQT